jgi:hypothetical protein
VSAFVKFTPTKKGRFTMRHAFFRNAEATQVSKRQKALGTDLLPTLALYLGRLDHVGMPGESDSQKSRAATPPWSTPLSASHRTERVQDGPFAETKEQLGA